MSKFLKITLIFFILLAIAAGLFIEFGAPYTPIKPWRPGKKSINWRLPNGSEPENYGLRPTRLNFISKDSLKMEGWFFEGKILDEASPTSNIQNPKSSKPLTIIMLHGIGSYKERFLGSAKRFTDEGFNVVLFDLRAHGQSEGEFCTFGFQEKNDISILVDSLLAGDTFQNIGIFGHSLGGAIALQALAEDKRLKFGIIESTFHDFEKVAGQYCKNYVGFSSDWLVQRVLKKSGELACFDPFSIKPFLAAEKISQPIFMAHGERDERIPISFGKINFEHLTSEKKEWHTVAGGTHLTMWQAGGEPYIQLIFKFLNDQK